MLKDTDQVVISGRRWFDKKNGNTYHSCRVFLNGELVGEVPFTYGYGDQWYQTGKEILINAGYWPKTGEVLSSGAKADEYNLEMYIREHRNNFTCLVSDVSRKKDL